MHPTSLGVDKVRLGTRASKLALWQAGCVRDLLIATHPDLEVELVHITTSGDRIRNRSLVQGGGKGLFVKELEESLLAGETDIAVHSMKDVPVELPRGLHIPVVCERGDPRDAYIANHYSHPQEMPPGSCIGTSSLRRTCQLRKRYPGLSIVELRGNVDTRLRKLDEGGYHAVVMAAAGLLRLGWRQRITAFLSPEESVPAMAQGTIGIECREGDEETLARIRPIDHWETALRTRAEWAFNRRLGGGCEVPIGGYAKLDGGTLHLRGMVGEPNGSQVLEETISGPIEEPERLGTELAENLLALGAGSILNRVTGHD